MNRWFLLTGVVIGSGGIVMALFATLLGQRQLKAWALFGLLLAAVGQWVTLEASQRRRQ